LQLVPFYGDPLADSAGFERLADAWNAHLDRHPKDKRIIDETIKAAQYCKPEFAEKLLLAKGDQPALGRFYANAVLGLNGDSYTGYNRGASIPELRQSAFAKRAYGILDSATDPTLLTAAAVTTLRSGGDLWADGKLDGDYTIFGNKLLLMARAAGSTDQVLLTLRTTLPARGERPPRMLRIGGNVQSANLVRKVTPVYPPEAKRKGVSGTVRFLALIGLDGRIMDLQLVSGPPELVKESLRASSQWEYKPVLLNGKPAYVRTQLDMNYTISR
jgi:hypothetical protein